MQIRSAAVIRLLGELHRTRDGRQFAIDFAQIIPSTGAYDLVLFGVRHAETEFSMGVVFPHDSASAWGAYDALVHEGLGQIRTQLERGNTEDGSLVEIPATTWGGWRPSYRFSVPSKTRYA
jgi:hypothetical protein